METKLRRADQFRAVGTPCRTSMASEGPGSCLVSLGQGMNRNQVVQTNDDCRDVRTTFVPSHRPGGPEVHSGQMASQRSIPQSLVPSEPQSVPPQIALVTSFPMGHAGSHSALLLDHQVRVSGEGFLYPAGTLRLLSCEGGGQQENPAFRAESQAEPLPTLPEPGPWVGP